jgi:hypothetical protein
MTVPVERVAGFCNTGSAPLGSASGFTLGMGLWLLKLGTFLGRLRLERERFSRSVAGATTMSRIGRVFPRKKALELSTEKPSAGVLVCVKDGLLKTTKSRPGGR